MPNKRMDKLKRVLVYLAEDVRHAIDRIVERRSRSLWDRRVTKHEVLEQAVRELAEREEGNED